MSKMTLKYRSWMLGAAISMALAHSTLAVARRSACRPMGVRGGDEAQMVGDMIYS